MTALYSGLPKSRTLAQGVSDMYFTGKPCKYGHLSPKYTKSGACCECFKERSKSKKEEIAVYNKEYRQKNRDAIYQREKEYLQKNREKRTNYKRQYDRNRYANDIDFRLCKQMSRHVYRAIKCASSVKDKSTLEYLGYSSSELKAHIESKFAPGMSWENYGEWHIDHKYPVSRFIQDGVTDPAIINALDNLTPLWATDNLKKGAMNDEEFFHKNPDLIKSYA